MEQSPSRKLTSSQLVKKFPSFHATIKIITAFTKAYHLSLCWARPTQSLPPFHFLKIHLILYSHLHQGLPSGLFPSGFPTKILYPSLLSPTTAVSLFWRSVPNAARTLFLVMVTFALPRTSFLPTDYFDTSQSFSVWSVFEGISTVTSYTYLFRRIIPHKEIDLS